MFCLFWAAVGAGCGSDRPPGANAPESQDRTAAQPVPAPIPKIDVHLHIDLEAAREALAILNEQHIAIGLNASGGEPGHGLEQSIAFATQSRGQLLPYCNVRLGLIAAPDFDAYARGVLEACKAAGGKGLKIHKYLGLGLVDAAGALVPVDDPRLDVLFDTAGKLGLPVLLHSGDPKAFFLPPDANNERYEELSVHPGWSFHGSAPNGQPWPSWESLLAQFEARVARHPGTTFVGAHFGNAAEEPERVARMLRTYPNLVIDTAARVPEFGRHAAASMRRIFIEHQDRILFGSDLAVTPSGLTLGSGGERPGTRDESRTFFLRHWQYFETDTKRLPNPTPIQGRWTVDGIGLPRAVLEKLYFRNAVRVFGLRMP
jgi:hypothetical protein